MPPSGRRGGLYSSLVFEHETLASVDAVVVVVAELLADLPLLSSKSSSSGVVFLAVPKEGRCKLTSFMISSLSLGGSQYEEASYSFRELLFYDMTSCLIDFP